MLVVVIGEVVNPNGNLERFAVFPPKNCEGQPSSTELSRAWKVSACMAQSLKKLTPTYQAGEEPRMMYTWHAYDLRMPHRIIPRQAPGMTPGSTPDNPVILIDESLPAQLDEKDPSHVCAGNLDMPSA
jgi:hypothetical protein